MPAQKDITNMRFNHLVAIEKAPSRKGHTYWKFRCDCGTEKEIMKCHVVGEVVKSCGCLSTQMAIQNIRFAHDNHSIIHTIRDNNPRICRICNNQFFGFTNDRRIYCYKCAPNNVSDAQKVKYKQHAVKHLLVQYKGGKCVECGYDKCEGALHFHHVNPAEKDFTLSTVRPGPNFNMADMYKEADKCVLLCANCHFKKHKINDVVGLVMKLPPINTKRSQTKQCKVCDAEFVTSDSKREYCYNCAPYGLNVTDAMRTKKRALKNELLKYKGCTCVKCGHDDKDVLQLHHRDPSQKEFTFSSINLNDTNFSMDKMREEADKCDVLCANCHCEVHYDSELEEININQDME